MSRSNKFGEILLLTILLSILVISFISISPYHVPVPHRDSGIFLQIGSELLHGKTLYMQAWGNNPPLIFIINAVGLWLGQGSAWGVSGLEFIFFLVMLAFCYRILRPSLSPFKSFFLVSISFITIFKFMSGNFTEEYALLFQVLILVFLFFYYLPNRSRHSRPLASFGIGLLMGVAFSIKQSYLDIGASVVIFTVFLAWLEKNKKIFSHLSLIGLGFVIPILLFIIYFYQHEALNDYITSAYLFNRYYLSLGLLEWIHTILENFEFVSTDPILLIMGTIWLGTIGVLVMSGKKLYQGFLNDPRFKWILFGSGLVCWLLFFWGEMRGGSPGIGLVSWAAIVSGSSLWLGAIYLALRKPAGESDLRSQIAQIRTQLIGTDWTIHGEAVFLFLGLIDLPVVLLGISLSGRNYTHYYISLFPAIFLLLTGGMIYLIKRITNFSHKLVFNWILIAVLLTASFAPMLYTLTNLSRSTGEGPFSETASYLRSGTTPQDKILVWGWESVIYFLAQRQPPTRYAFQFPAYFNTPFRQTVLKTLFEDIKADPPLFIADTLSEEMPLIENRSPEDCLSGSTAEDEILRNIISYVCTNYEFDKRIEEINIYKKK